MKSRIGIAGAALLFALATACSNPATDEAAEDGALPASCSEDTPVLGVSLPNTVNPYYVAMQDSFESSGQEAGFEVEVAIANDSDSNQLSQVQAFIEQGVCAVALNGVNSAPAVASVNALNQAGIPVFTVNVIVDGEELDAQGAEILQYVGADQVAGGTVMGEQVITDLGADTPYVVGIVGNPDQLPTNQRDQGFTDALEAGAAQVEVVGTVNGKVDPNISLQVTTELLQGNPDINVIWADTGPHTVGALQAVAQLGLEDEISVYGFCAAEQTLEGPYKACSAQEPARYASIVVEQVSAYLDGEDIEPEILEPLKVFVAGETPAPGEVG